MFGVAVALALVGTLAGGVFAAAPAGAQAAPVDPEAVKVAIDLYRNRALLEDAAAKVVDAQARLAAAEAALAATDAKIAVTTAKVTELEGELTGRAAELYIKRGGDISDVLQIDHVQDLNRGTHYTNTAAADSNAKLAVLAKAQRELEQLRADQALARNTIADEKARYDAVFADLQAANARDAALLARLGAVPIMGDSQLTGPQLAAWFRSIRGQARIADGTTIDELAQMFVEEGAAEHLRGDIAFAQTMVETGSLSQTRGNNFSGIGNCDSCGGVGMMFPNSREGVRAQIQLLRNYADPTSRAANLANPPVTELYGSDPGSAARSYDTFFAKGRAPLWNVMGNGNWATDPIYAGKVLSIYESMVGYTALHPGG
jgi:hypothetical protein